MSTIGRPREFDIEDALDAALELFWAKGFEGATIPDLTTAMRINRPSLYAAFGNKEALFHKVVQRYAEGPASYGAQALALPTARAVAEALLYGAVKRVTQPGSPRGCLLVQGALTSGERSDEVRAMLAAQRARGEAALCERLQRAKAEGDLPPDANPHTLAQYIATTTYGIAVQAAGGTPRDELMQVAETALKGWPESPTDKNR